MMPRSIDLNDRAGGFHVLAAVTKVAKTFEHYAPALSRIPTHCCLSPTQKHARVNHNSARLCWMYRELDAAEVQTLLTHTITKPAHHGPARSLRVGSTRSSSLRLVVMILLAMTCLPQRRLLRSLCSQWSCSSRSFSPLATVLLTTVS